MKITLGYRKFLKITTPQFLNYFWGIIAMTLFLIFAE